MAEIEDLLESRYYQEGEREWEDIAFRVAKELFPTGNQNKYRLYAAMTEGSFLPSSPVLMNAGSSYPMMCSCFVLPIYDDIDGIMEALHQTVRIQKYGGGVGMDFSPIRPEGSGISTTGGRASGPVSFMKFWNAAMQVIRQAGKRQGALMGVLRWNHPDIDRFMRAKQEEGILTNFNISVGLDEKFWESLKYGDENARKVLAEVSTAAWNNGEPGVLFLDNINKNSAYDERITATNPCGEVPLPPYGACCLGSINVANCVEYDTEEGARFDFSAFRYYVRLGIRTLDRVIAKSWWPWPKIEDFELNNWPLGLGIMGLADTLALLGLPYASSEGRKFVKLLMQEMRSTAEVMSKYVAEVYDHPVHKTLLSIAPTGSISMLSDWLSGRCSYSIEPYFTMNGHKNVEEGSFEIVNSVLDTASVLRGFNITDEDKEIIAETGSVKETSLPDEEKEVFRTATEMDSHAHLLMQSAVQKYVDNSVSKTINMPYDSTVEDIVTIIKEAHALGCKGLTMYRTNSRKDEVIACPSGVCDL